MWWRVVEWGRTNRKTNEEHEEVFVEEGFQLARIVMGNGSINIGDGSELELAWSKKNSLHFENNFPIFSLSSIWNTLTFKVRDLLNWVNFLVMKNLSNIFRSTFCWSKQYSNKIYIIFIFSYCQQVIFTLRVPLLLSLLNYASVNIADDEDSFSFLLKLNSHGTYITLSTDTEAKSAYFAPLSQCWKYT